MRIAGSRNRSTPEKKRQILDAALAVFSEKGVQLATMEDIRERSGASKGSIYHHFESKEQIAIALYLDALEELHGRMREALAKARTAQGGIRGLVAAYVRWFPRRRELGQFLFTAMVDESFMRRAKSIRSAEEGFLGEVLVWAKPYIESGEMIALSPSLYVAIVIGPCRDFFRRWLHAPSARELEGARVALPRAAWRGVAKAKRTETS